MLNILAQIQLYVNKIPNDVVNIFPQIDILIIYNQKRHSTYPLQSKWKRIHLLLLIRGNSYLFCFGLNARWEVLTPDQTTKTGAQIPIASQCMSTILFTFYFYSFTKEPFFLSFTELINQLLAMPFFFISLFTSSLSFFPLHQVRKRKREARKG